MTIDQLVLRSERPVPQPPTMPAVSPDWESDVRLTVEIPPGDVDRWLVLGQSHNPGWTATLDGVSLGSPTLVDGFANGWAVPAAGGTVELVWTPQQLVDRALAFSAVAVLAILVLAVRSVPNSAGRTTVAMPTFIDPPRRGVRRSRRTAVLAAVGTGLFALVNLPSWPVAALALAGVAAFGVRDGKGLGFQPLSLPAFSPSRVC